MTRQQVLDLYFMDARHRLIEIAAFMDRVERSTGDEDFRMHGFREALKELEKGNSDAQVYLATGSKGSLSQNGRFGEM